jgi:hypothetical protein
VDRGAADAGDDVGGATTAVSPEVGASRGVLRLLVMGRGYSGGRITGSDLC